jgi:hypothetical protein
MAVCVLLSRMQAAIFFIILTETHTKTCLHGQKKYDIAWEISVAGPLSQPVLL